MQKGRNVRLHNHESEAMLLLALLLLWLLLLPILSRVICTYLRRRWDSRWRSWGKIKGALWKWPYCTQQDDLNDSYTKFPSINHHFLLTTVSLISLELMTLIAGEINIQIILIHIQNVATLHRLFYLETALHVSGGTSTHHQERKQLYLQHLVFVRPLLLPAAIAAGSNNGLTNTRCCGYSCMRSWWWVELTPETCRAVSR